MPSLALRPRSPTEIVDTAIQVLKAHYGQFVTCAALAYAPWLLIELLFLEGPNDITTRGWQFGVLGMLGSLVVYAIMSSLLVVCASRVYLGEDLDVGDVVRATAPKLPRVIVATLLRCLWIAIGMLAFLIGGLWVSARLFAVTPAILLESATVDGAFARSRDLSAGRKRHIINTYGLILVIYWVLGMGLSMLSLTFGTFQVQLIVSALFTMLAYPVIAITGTLLYYDTRIQGEGLDIELMADALAPSAAGTPSP